MFVLFFLFFSIEYFIFIFIQTHFKNKYKFSIYILLLIWLKTEDDEFDGIWRQ